MKDLFCRGLKGPFKEKDLYANIESLDSDRVTEKFGVLWEDELKRTSPSIIRTIIRAYGVVFIPLGFFYAMMESTAK